LERPPALALYLLVDLIVITGPFPTATSPKASEGKPCDGRLVEP
jgi:hypothetical protein